MVIVNWASCPEKIPGETKTELTVNLKKSIKSLQSDLEIQMKAARVLNLKPLVQDIVSGKSYFVKRMNLLLKGQMDKKDIRVDILVNDTNVLMSLIQVNIISGGATTWPPEISWLEDLIVDIFNCLNKFDSLNDSDSVKFGGLDLRL